MKKAVFPVAKYREDGTPAIWLTHDHWLILQPGIVRSYIEASEDLAKFEVRTRARKELGPQNKHLQEWELLDSWPIYSSRAEATFDLFKAGFDAWGHICADNPHRWTPEKLKEIAGNIAQKAADQERAKIQSSEQEKAAA